MRIRTRITLLTLFPLAAAILVAGLYLAFNHRRQARERAQERMEALLDGAARLARESMRAKDELMMAGYMRSLVAERPELSFAAVTWRGRTSVYGAPSGGVELKTRVAVWDEGNSGYGAAGASRERMTIQLGFSSDWLERESRRRLKDLLGRLLVIAAAATALGLLAAAWTAGRLAAPIAALAASANAVGEGTLDAVLEERGDDEIVALAGRFNAMTGRLKDLLLFKEDLLHTLTHELNTPMTGLKVCCDRLGGAQDAERERVLGTMRAALERMEDTLLNALELFRAAEAPALRRRPVRLGALVEEVLRLQAPAAERRRVRIEPLQGDAWVAGDEELLRRVVSNLVSNAVKYAPADGTVTIALVQKGGEARLSVKDTGRGIAAQDRERLFTKFYRARPLGGRARIPGSGLGLAIAKRAVDLHGGRIWVESEPGKGSDFIVALPAAPEAAADVVGGTIKSRGDRL